MKASNIRPGGLIAVAVGLAVVAALLAARFVNVSAPSDHSASRILADLPAGVCPYSSENLPVGEATRMQAKLVLFDIALASDPHFPFKGSLGSSAAQQEPIRVANYFWITAAEDNFHNDLPRPPGAQVPEAVHYLVVYRPADRCAMDGGDATEGLGAWPAWFDTVQALSTRTLK